MKLDLSLWKTELRRIEADLKARKAQARHPPDDFDFGAVRVLKAEATRLYCLRRHVCGKLHASGTLLRLIDAPPYVRRQAVTDLAAQEELLRADPDWLEWMTRDEDAVASG